jgi:hypothetical protein
MPTAPSGYIWLKGALARLGPLLIGSGWIAELTRRERWLVENHAPITPGPIAYIRDIRALFPHDERDELGAALNRDRKMRSQHEQAEEWLSDRDLLFEGDDGKGTVVPIAGFEAALKEDGLLAMEVAAQASASANTTPQRRKNTKLAAVTAFIAEEYPDGLPAGLTYKQIVLAFEAKTHITVSERVVSRSLGGK